MNFKEIKVILNSLNKVVLSIKNKEEFINGINILFIFPAMGALVFGKNFSSMAIILFGGMVGIGVLMGLIQVFVDSLITKDKSKIIDIFNNDKKDIILFLYENIPEYMKKDFDDFKVSIMKDNYIVAIDQINKLLNEIEVTTERTKNIENFDNLMKFEVAQEKEREINITYQL